PRAGCASSRPRTRWVGGCSTAINSCSTAPVRSSRRAGNSHCCRSAERPRLAFSAMTRIAVIGGGRIGEALIAGLLESGRLGKDLVVVETHTDRAELIASRFGVRVTGEITDGAVGADLLVVAVKPGDVDGVLVQLG